MSRSDSTSRGTDVHSVAIERHAIWALELAFVGELDDALDELRDLGALAAESGEAERGLKVALDLVRHLRTLAAEPDQLDRRS